MSLFISMILIFISGILFGSLFLIFVFWWAVVVEENTVEKHNGKMRFFNSDGTLRNPDKR